MPEFERHVPRLICKTCRRDVLIKEHYKGDRYVGFEILGHGEPFETVCDDLDPVKAEDFAGDLVSCCDFCSAPGPTWEFPCGDFTLSVEGTTSFGSVGAWGVCSECLPLVETCDWEAVLRRFVEVHELPDDSERQRLLPMWEGFAKHRTGMAMPYDTA